MRTQEGESLNKKEDVEGESTALLLFRWRLSSSAKQCHFSQTLQRVLRFLSLSIRKVQMSTRVIPHGERTGECPHKDTVSPSRLV